MTAPSTAQGAILVTGAGGLAASAVVRAFVQSGQPVRNPAKAARFAAFPLVEVVEGDMARPETLTRALAGVDRALLASSPDPHIVEVQTAFIDAAAKSGVQHIVKFSGLSAADVDSTFVFADMHAKIEQHLERSGVGWTHLRPSQFMTEYLREWPTILAQGALFLPLQDARLVPVDVVDVARAARLLLTTPGHAGKTYAMSGPEALSMTEIAERVTDAVGRETRYVAVTREQRKQALLAAGVPPFFVDALDAQAGERLRGAESVVHPETHTALGIRPTTFAEFARRNAGAFLGELAYVGLT
ncbi:SDR family oxidoreductase [Dactylosporangium matsuzakiense]|uniref:Nucleotide-diphosphate-sugar epimerase n=1 Tax=Dactylosporangium matsuzakiense TaxID=53360 RepID=A0A9W6KFS9_9ACTN|nr:SDR family oxidoreductase [Dactylosporangium matsuzakiense]GLK99254.1 nucleotide-diphosphate-sugar epimerase [Dactylosporangium matsuzakiense]